MPRKGEPISLLPSECRVAHGKYEFSNECHLMKPQRIRLHFRQLENHPGLSMTPIFHQQNHNSVRKNGHGIISLGSFCAKASL